MNGTLKNKADNTIIDEELLIQFKKIEKLSSKEKLLIKEFLSAFIFKANIKQQIN